MKRDIEDTNESFADEVHDVELNDVYIDEANFAEADEDVAYADEADVAGNYEVIEDEEANEAEEYEEANEADEDVAYADEADVAGNYEVIDDEEANEIGDEVGDIVGEAEEGDNVDSVNVENGVDIDSEVTLKVPASFIKKLTNGDIDDVAEDVEVNNNEIIDDNTDGNIDGEDVAEAEIKDEIKDNLESLNIPTDVINEFFSEIGNNPEAKKDPIRFAKDYIKKFINIVDDTIETDGAEENEEAAEAEETKEAITDNINSAEKSENKPENKPENKSEDKSENKSGIKTVGIVGAVGVAAAAGAFFWVSKSKKRQIIEPNGTIMGNMESIVDYENALRISQKYLD